MKDIPLARLCSKDYIRTVGRAWEKFVTDRPVEDDDVVRDVVIESWHRCRQNGVNPATKSAPLRVKGPDVDRFQLSNAEFYDAVRACVPPIVPLSHGVAHHPDHQRPARHTAVGRRRSASHRPHGRRSYCSRRGLA